MQVYLHKAALAFWNGRNAHETSDRNCVAANSLQSRRGCGLRFDIVTFFLKNIISLLKFQRKKFKKVLFILAGMMYTKSKFNSFVSFQTKVPKSIQKQIQFIWVKSNWILMEFEFIGEKGKLFYDKRKV